MISLFYILYEVICNKLFNKIKKAYICLHSHEKKLIYSELKNFFKLKFSNHSVVDENNFHDKPFIKNVFSVLKLA